VRHYGALVARQILATGARVNVWDIGNEVEFGVAGVAVRALGGGPYGAPDRVDTAIGQMSAGQLVGMPEAERILAAPASVAPRRETARGHRAGHRLGGPLSALQHAHQRAV
jgi:hypothetical protein